MGQGDGHLHALRGQRLRERISSGGQTAKVTRQRRAGIGSDIARQDGDGGTMHAALERLRLHFIDDRAVDSEL